MMMMMMMMIIIIIIIGKEGDLFYVALLQPI